jgi:hypothetical protein
MKYLILLLAIAGFAVQAQAQELMVTDVPEAVVTAFNKSNPLVSAVDWNKDGSNFVAEFAKDKVETSLTYDVTGQVVESKIQIPVASLPQGVTDYMTTNHKEYVVEDASKITNAIGTITYETEVDGKMLIFDAKGTYLKSEEELVLSK